MNDDVTKPPSPNPVDGPGRLPEPSPNQSATPPSQPSSPPSSPGINMPPEHKPVEPTAPESSEGAQALPPADRPTKQARSVNTTLAVIAAIIIALALVGVGWLAYQNSSKKVDTTPKPAEQTEQTDNTASEDTTTPADGSTVNDALEETDSLLNDADRLESTNQDTLSDQELGL